MHLAPRELQQGLQQPRIGRALVYFADVQAEGSVNSDSLSGYTSAGSDRSSISRFRPLLLPLTFGISSVCCE